MSDKTETSHEGDGPPTTRRHIQSVNVGFSLIRCLADAPASLSLKELCNATGMSSSQVHMYMASFVLEGMVVQDPATARYDLGPFAMDLGLAAMRKLDVLEVARPAMAAMRDETGESVFLTVWGNYGPTIVAKADGSRPSAVILRVGYVLSALDSATGCLYLAFLPEGATRQVVARERADTSSPASELSDEQVSALIERTRRTGLGSHDGLRIDGFTGLSAPLIDHSGVMRAALTVTGPAQDFADRENGTIATALRQVASEISSRLGYRPQQ
jgi:DNA-binding IclR family transcriptional regulator